MNEKAELLDPLKCLYNALLHIENLDAQKQQLIANAQAIQQQIQQEQRREINSRNMSGIAKKGASAGMAVGIAFTVIGFMILYVIFIFFMAAFGIENKILYVLITIILMALAALIIFSLVKASDHASKTSDQRSNNTAINVRSNISQYESQIQDLQERQIPEADARLIIAYQDAQPLIESFPPDYCYSEAVGKVISYLENRRADSLKEALNVYENELYQNRLLAEQQKQTQAAQTSAKANVISAVANIATAFNTGQIASNTSQMVGSLRNIEGYSAQTAANSAAAARSAAAAANNTARAADNSAQMANYARQIRNNLNGNPSWL